jgi:hypothetical protein
MVYATPVPYEGPAERGPAPAPAPSYVEIGADDVETAQTETAQQAWFEETPALDEPQSAMQRSTSATATLTTGVVDGPDIAVYRVRLGPDVQQIKVARSAGVQVGDHNRQLNQYRFRIDKPQVSLDRLLKEHPATLRSFGKLVANPHSWMANYAFRHHLPTRPAATGRGVLFADTTRPSTTRISTHLDEHGATVVDNSRGVQVGDHNRMRNDFSYKLTGQELSLGRMLRDRPDLVRSLAMTVRHPGNPAVQRSFTRQISDAYTHGGAPSLRILDRDLPGSRLEVDQGAGVQIGIGNTRTDRVSVDMRRLALTGWDVVEERVTAKVEEPAPAPQAIDGPHDVVRPAARLALGIRQPALSGRHPPDPVENPGSGISPLG